MSYLQVLKLKATYYTAYFELWICCWAEEQVDNEIYKYVYRVRVDFEWW